MLRRFLKTYYKYMADHKMYFLLGIVGAVLASAAQGGIAYIVQPIMDRIFKDKNEQLLYVVPAVLVALFFMKGLGGYMQAYFMNYIGLNIIRKVRNDMLSKLLLFEMDFFNKKRSGELVSRITYDINLIKSAVSSYFADLFKNAITIIVLVIIIILQSNLLALVGLIIMPLASFPIIVIMKKLKKLSREGQESSSDITSRLVEIFNNMEIIKASNGESVELHHFEVQNLRFFKINIRAIRVSQITSPLMEILGAVAMAIVMVIGGLEVMKDNMTTGEFFAFLTAMLLLYTPIKSSLNSLNGLQDALVAGERVSSILNMNPKIVDGTRDIVTPIDTINVVDASLRYDDRLALNNVSLTLRKNKTTAIIGRSGSGKSTLINAILRLYDLSSGSILINNTNIVDYSQKSIRDRVAIVTQRNFIFNDSIASNVAYGMELDESRVVDALKQSQIYDFVSTLDDGIYTVLEEFGANLSGGQKQRIAIARAIYRNPDVLILDEATSALDEETERDFRKSLESLRKDKILLIIAHRPATLSLADEVVQMDSGKIVGVYTREHFSSDGHIDGLVIE